MNEIVFPAAILQPPFFDLEADDAVNYGGIGAVIGHEIGHGFDDQGSKFDGDGNLNDWWTDADRKEFESRAKMLIEQYNGFEPAQLPGQHVNGALTIGENIGDLGGLTIAYKAYTISLKGKRGAGDRRPDRRPAVLHRLGPGLAAEVPRRRADPRGWPPTRTRRPSSAATAWSATSPSSTRPSASRRATSSGCPPTSASGSGERPLRSGRAEPFPRRTPTMAHGLSRWFHPPGQALGLHRKLLAKITLGDLTKRRKRGRITSGIWGCWKSRCIHACVSVLVSRILFHPLRRNLKSHQ